MKTLREAKISAVQQIFIDEFWRSQWNTKRAAERVLSAIEQVELDYEQEERTREFAV